MFIGIDIGGTKCAVSFGEYESGNIEIVKKVKFNTADFGPYEAIDEFIRIIGDVGTDIQAIGISCGCPLDSRGGVILSPPNLPGWDNIEIVKILRERFNIPVFLQNDANACAIAEWKFGAARGYRNVVFLTFGTGMGAGLILNGAPYEGTSDMAGEVGHIRLSERGPVGFGKSGSFEGFCSGGGITQLGRIYAAEKWQTGESVGYCKGAEDADKITAKDICDAAKAGDETAMCVIRDCAEKLGAGLSIIIDILNPEIIVIGSIYERCEELFAPIANKVIEKEALIYSRKVCKIAPAALGDMLGDYAALAVGINGIEKGDVYGAL